MKTSVIWKRSRAPQWADQALTRALELWGRQVNPIESRFMFRGLLYSTLAVPIENQPADSDQVTLRMNDTSASAFTHPDLLVRYAVRHGWISEDQAIPWVPFQGKELFTELAAIDGIDCRVNPGTSSLRLTTGDLRRLLDGGFPESRPESGPTTIASGLPQIEPALGDFPELTVTMVRSVLQGYPEVESAVLYRPPHCAPVLGLHVLPPRTARVDKAVASLEKILRSVVPEASVLLLNAEMSASLKIPPFYTRGY
jgi:hypothetical protein